MCMNCSAWAPMIDHLGLAAVQAFRPTRLLDMILSYVHVSIFAIVSAMNKVDHCSAIFARQGMA
jgi:hypothetical protein